MSFIGSMFGAGKGSDFQAAGNPNITEDPTNQAQINTAYGQTQSGLSSQQALLDALAAQGSQGQASQTQLGNQLMAQSLGQGPNPAQAQFAQNTGANVANQAALMAGQRGAGANVGLMARQAAMQGAQTQQQAAGQAMTGQAQQTLAAQQQLQNLAGTQVGQQTGAITGYNQAAQSEQANLLGAQANYGNTQAGILNGMNTNNSATQIQNSKAQQGIFGGLLGGAGSILAQGGEVGYADGGTAAPAPQPERSKFTNFLYGSAKGNSASSPGGFLGAFNANQDNGGNPIQGGMSNLVSAIGKKYIKPMFQKSPVENAGQGPTMENAATLPGNNPAAPFDMSGATPLEIETPDAALEGADAAGAGEAAGAAEGAEGAAAAGETAEGVESLGSLGSLAELAAKGGMVRAVVSPGEVYLSPKNVEQVRRGADPMTVGEKIGGKPRVGGAKNSYANDTVPKKLTAGGIVVPRSETKSENPSRNSAKFVAQILAKRRTR